MPTTNLDDALPENTTGCVYTGCTTTVVFNALACVVKIAVVLHTVYTNKMTMSCRKLHKAVPL